jgi:adenylosuccinate synthase
MPVSIKANGVSYDFHLLPSGLVAPQCINFIGSAVVFHVPSFFNELADVEAKGIKDARQRIFVSDRCHINFDLHAAVDGLEEVELGANAVGPRSAKSVNVRAPRLHEAAYDKVAITQWLCHLNPSVRIICSDETTQETLSTLGVP